MRLIGGSARNSEALTATMGPLFTGVRRFAPARPRPGKSKTRRSGCSSLAISGIDGASVVTSIVRPSLSLLTRMSRMVTLELAASAGLGMESCATTEASPNIAQNAMVRVAANLHILSLREAIIRLQLATVNIGLITIDAQGATGPTQEKIRTKG